jgi:alkanesulfonate monooxygenase SsuD/methylene tetrahydromethanopterin reductase-like flavin-dependent oxidoreductase (luciferase family)
VTVDTSGHPISGEVVRDTIEEAVLADAVGIDSFNLGEHYRAELMDTAGHVMLAAIAGRTAHSTRHCGDGTEHTRPGDMHSPG